MSERIQIGHVLCPTDYSVFASRALRHASALARQFSARLTLLNVVPAWPSTLGGDAPYPPLAAQPVARRLFEHDLAAYAQPVIEERVAVETLVEEGEPWREIVRAARELPADLLVMGTHGRSGFEELLLGSVTEKVLRRAPCSVLTVCHEEGRPWEAPGLIARILCATDLTAASDATLQYAASLAAEYQTSLTLLHVLEGIAGEAEPGYRELPETAWRRRLEGLARERLESAVSQDTRAWCQIDTRLAIGRAHQQILRVAVEEKADLT